MDSDNPVQISDVIGAIPYRMAFAGGWIDQPFMSRRNPTPPGSMVTVCIHPTFRLMDRCGMSTSTRKVAARLWGGIPEGDPELLVRELYAVENEGLPEPSGSQDMVGLIYPGVNRIDYDAAHEGGYFPVHVESNTDPDVARWIEQVVSMVPICPRPNGYNPLGDECLDPEWVGRLGQSGKECFDAIVGKDLVGLGAAMNECMLCWETLLPHVVTHDTLTVDLKAILTAYQARYPGAMFSGCGGGYLYVVSDEPVPGGIRVSVKEQ
ncbi:MAG: hypothetical protein HN919_14200 [Verrucomicrobia bacterium]|jgi:hypothetical protein|nr:hypothetical protein [Verrucomicrobiota bacterium]MBT7067451.1 hypothetical protein [Verrucomicrobiota bacterium]MBT7700154.1 hypothetical protein [Verrucomicrobiota bacterium]